jgi:excisionase family DNA binding protein
MRSELAVLDQDTDFLLTVPEVARILRTSAKAIYEMIRRKRLPGVTPIGRRRLIRRDALLHWLDHKSASSDRSIR